MTPLRHMHTMILQFLSLFFNSGVLPSASSCCRFVSSLEFVSITGNKYND